MSEIWAAWEEVSGRKTSRTLNWLWHEYCGTRRFRERATETRDGYERAFKRIAAAMTKDGMSFGDIKIVDITPLTIRTYVDKRSETAPVAANRELALLRTMFRFAREYDYLSNNPASGIKANKEEPRDRLVMPEEFWAVHDQANPQIKIAMRLAVGLRLRLNEILKLSWSDADEQRGVIRATRSKGSKTQDVTITPLLEGAIELAKNEPHKGSELVSKSSGGRYTRSGFESSWKRLWANMKEPPSPFTFHDLKAAGVSWANDPRLASGHKSGRMTEVYDRRIRTVEGTDL